MPDIAKKNVAPSLAQLRWHGLEYYGFIHFSINTFTGREWGYGDESPELFNPTELDARQWADVAVNAGMKGLILTCKHHDGFCLWPSRYTEHSVKNSPWKNGKGDLVRELSCACRDAGLKFGVYLSPWDRNHAEYGRPAYIEYYRNQLRELLTGYGDIFEVWLDGANGGDGYYGGANEVRQIDNSTYYDWPNTVAIIRELQPTAMIFSDAGPDIRWIGNEKGLASDTTWYTLDSAGRYPGYNYPGYDCFTDLGQGHRYGSSWIPPEADVSIRPGWFYHQSEDTFVKTPLKLMELYYNSVGRGANLLLNLPPDRRGLINEIDVKNVMAFKKARDEVFKFDIAGNAQIIKYDDSMIVNFDSPVQMNHIVINEDISKGQHISSWQIDALIDGQWQRLDAGTSIGYKRILRFKGVSAASIKITTDCTQKLGSVSIFDSHVCLTVPEICRDENGMVAIDAGDAVIRYTVDGSDVSEHSELYMGPFLFDSMGKVNAAILMQDNPDLIMLFSQNSATANFGITKKQWKVAGMSGQHESHPAKNAIDSCANTFWLTDISVDQHAEICIDFGRSETIKTIGYLPPQHGNVDAIVTGYAIYLSDSLDDMTLPVAKGTFDNIQNNPIEQRIELNTPVTARFLKFVALSTCSNKTAGICAIEIYTI